LVPDIATLLWVKMLSETVNEPRFDIAMSLRENVLPAIATSPYEEMERATPQFVNSELDNATLPFPAKAAIVPEKFKAVHFSRLPGGEPPPEFVARLQQFFSTRRA
jgi:hypothetical protein